MAAPVYDRFSDISVDLGEKEEWRDEVRGELTPGPTPAMMAMVLLDMVLEWETMEERRVVGCMNRRVEGKGIA